MRRRKADDVAKKTAALLASTKTESSKLSSVDPTNVEITDETFTRIGSTDLYTREEIDCLGRIITKNYTDNCWTVAVDLNELTEFLNSAVEKQVLVDSIESITSLSIVYNRRGVHWVTLVITKVPSVNHVTVFYKDSFGAGMDEELEQFLTGHFSSHEYSIEILSSLTAEQEDDVSCGPMSLRNLEIILIQLRSQLEAGDLEEIRQQFNSLQFCRQDEVAEVKKGFQSKWMENQKNYLKFCLTQLENEDDKLASDFKKDLNNFIDFCVEFQNGIQTETGKSYGEILAGEINSFEADPNYKINTDLIDEARKILYDSKVVKDSLEKSRANLNSLTIPRDQNKNFGENENQNLNFGRSIELEIEQKYPVKFKLFTNIFKILAKVENNESLQFLLGKISSVYGIEGGKLETFFKIQNKEEQKLEDDSETQEKLKKKFRNGLEKIVKNLPKSSTKCEEETGVKDLDEILKELEFDDTSIQINEQLKESVEKVGKYFTEWENKSLEEIGEWTWKWRKGEVQNFELDIHEALAVMDRANQLLTGGHRLRIPQILAILIFLQENRFGKNGRLCQVQAGEGKTTIVALLAAMKILQGHTQTVDIITSNPVLAQAAVTEKSDFYSLFGITVSTNNNSTSSSKNPASLNSPSTSYSAQVVYGSIGSFQFDYLLDKFEGRKIRNDRQFGCLILDEVDSMLIDNGGHIAKICGPLPGMDSLKYFYIRIWSALIRAEDTICSEMSKELQTKKEELLGQTGLSEKERETQYKDYSMNLYLSAADRLKELILRSTPLDNYTILPSHLKKFVHSSLDKWIDNALWAKYGCHENHHYRLTKVEGQRSSSDPLRVIPIDYANTGVSLNNTNWSGGLHQFIQLKHNLDLTPESMTCSSISNYGYIKLYSQIFGMTGTLGSTPEHQLLDRMYHLNFVRIPPFKKKRFRELPGLIVEDGDWATEVAIEVVDHVWREGRAILIISQTVADSMAIEKQIEILQNFLEEQRKKQNGSNFSKSRGRGRDSSKFGYLPINLHKFHDESDSSVMKRILGSGDVITATNIAGRGADFKTNAALEQNGGIHIVLSFLPDNERVRDQGFFRTSRQGNDGSARLIIRQSQIRDLDLQPPLNPRKSTRNSKLMDQVKIKKSQIEHERVGNLKIYKVAQLFLQDSIFSLFASYCQELSRRFELDPYILKDFKDFWAFWIAQKSFEDDATVTTNSEDWESRLMEKAQNVFSEFKKEALDVFKFESPSTPNSQIKGTVVSGGGSGASLNFPPPLNPFYCVSQADNILRQPCWKTEENLNEAEAGLKHAISLNSEPEILYSAYMKLFELSLEKGRVLINKFKDTVAKVFIVGHFLDVKNTNYKEEAFKYLLKAQGALETEIKFVEDELGGENFSNIISNRSQNTEEGNPNENRLVSQLQSKLICLKVYQQHVVQLQNQIKSCGPSIGLTIGSRVTNYLGNLEGRTEEERQLKKSIVPEVLTDLSNIGMDVMYGVLQVHDAPKEIVAGAQVQIGAGLSLYATGIAFLPSLPLIAPVAGTLISEGLMDIAMELVNYKRAYGFDGMAYVKSKVISYGISVVTLGLQAILSCTKIMEKAASACKYMSDVLRKCPYLKTVCELVAKGIDKLGLFFQKMIELSMKGQEMMKLTSLLYNAGKTVTIGVTSSVLMEKLVMVGLEYTLQMIKPQIENIVFEVISNSTAIRQPSISIRLMYLKRRNELDQFVQKVMTNSSLAQNLWEMAREISFGVSRHTSNWKVQATSLTLDTLLSINRIRSYPSEFCEKLKDAVVAFEKGEEDDGKDERVPMEKVIDDHVMAQLLWEISSQVSNHVYNSIVQLSGKLVNTLVVAPLVNKLFDFLFNKKLPNPPPEEENDENPERENSSELSNPDSLDCPEEKSSDIKSEASKKALALLGLEEGASPEDIKRAYRLKMREVHPDTNPDCDPETATKDSADLNNAREYLEGKCGAENFLNNVKDTNQASPSKADDGRKFGADNSNRHHFDPMDVESDPFESFSEESETSDYQQMDINPDGVTDNCYLTTMTSMERLEDVHNMEDITRHYHEPGSGGRSVEQILAIHGRSNAMEPLQPIPVQRRDQIDAFCRDTLPIGQQVDLGIGYTTTDGTGHMVTVRARRVSEYRIVYTTTDFQLPAGTPKRSFKGLPVSAGPKEYITWEEPCKYVIFDPGQSRHNPIPPHLMDKYRSSQF